MIQIQVHGLDEVIRAFGTLGRRQLPYAMARSLTDVAKLDRQELKEEMRSVFDRPTGFTLNSTRFEMARIDQLQSVVFFKELSATSSHHYLEPQVEGGSRPLKAFEKRLARAGIMRPGQFAVPGSGASLDAHGNVKRSQIVEILSYFATFREAGYSGNMTAANRARRARGTSRSFGYRYFSIPAGHRSGLHPGIYKKTLQGRGSSIKAVFLFVSGARYEKRLDVQRVAAKTYDANFNRIFAQHFQRAIATARR
jgi:hypothetical protein